LGIFLPIRKQARINIMFAASEYFGVYLPPKYPLIALKGSIYLFPAGRKKIANVTVLNSYEFSNDFSAYRIFRS
jgi:hypothetical protein